MFYTDDSNEAPITIEWDMDAIKEAVHEWTDAILDFAEDAVVKLLSAAGATRTE